MGDYPEGRNAMARRSKEAIYREKYNLIQKINKRIRDTVNKIGTMNETVQLWETALTLSGRETTTAYSQEDKMYHLLSRSKADIDKMSLKDLKTLEKQTPSWSTTKSQIVREMNADRKPGEQYTKANPPSLEEIKKAASLTQQLHKMFEENADLFYMLLDSTQVDDVKELSTLEMWEEVQKIQAQLDAGNPYNWTMPPEEVGEAYIARREKSNAAKNAALQKAYFEE